MTTTTTTDAGEADRALKAKHRAVWALGDYPAIATNLIPSLGRLLVEACDVRPGDRVLDVAAGSGNVAIPAALAGADVVASDLTPELLEVGRGHAAAAGVDIDWQEANAEQLPFADASFDVVLSCVGVVFAPHHQASADELLRVLRPGGRLGLLSWTPEGFIGQMFATMKPFAPAPPPGVQPPPLWGHVDHVHELFGDRLTDLTARQQDLVVDRFATPDAFRDYFKHNYGPTIAAYRSLGDDAARVAELDHALDALAERFDRGETSTVLDWEYLLVTATRASA